MKIIEVCRNDTFGGNIISLNMYLDEIERMKKIVEWCPTRCVHKHSNGTEEWDCPEGYTCTECANSPSSEWRYMTDEEYNEHEEEQYDEEDWGDDS